MPCVLGSFALNLFIYRTSHSRYKHFRAWWAIRSVLSNFSFLVTTIEVSCARTAKTNIMVHHIIKKKPKQMYVWGRRHFLIDCCTVWNLRKIWSHWWYIYFHKKDNYRVQTLKILNWARCKQNKHIISKGNFNYWKTSDIFIIDGKR